MRNGERADFACIDVVTLMVRDAKSITGGAPQPSAAVSGGGRGAWWRRIFHSAAGAAGLIAAGADAKASPVTVPSSEYQPAAAAPESWQSFARQVQGGFEQQLAGDSDAARQVQEYLVDDYLARRKIDTGAAPARFVVRAWIKADGKVNRIEIEGIGDAGAAADLRALLIDRDVGVPPPGMLQPLHLRLTSRPTENGRAAR